MVFQTLFITGFFRSYFANVDIMKSRRDERHLAPLTNALRNNTGDVIYYCLFIAAIPTEYFPAISAVMFSKCQTEPCSATGASRRRSVFLPNHTNFTTSSWRLRSSQRRHRIGLVRSVFLRDKFLLRNQSCKDAVGLPWCPFAVSPSHGTYH